MFFAALRIWFDACRNLFALTLDVLDNAFVIICLILRFDIIDYRLALIVWHKVTLNTHGLCRTSRTVKHIALAEELFRTAAIEDCTAVHIWCNRKRDTCWNVILDNTCHDIDGRTLGCNYKIHTCGTRKRRKTVYRALNLVLCRKHQVGKLIDDYYYLRQLSVRLAYFVHKFVISL